MAKKKPKKIEVLQIRRVPDRYWTSRSVEVVNDGYAMDVGLSVQLISRSCCNNPEGVKRMILRSNELKCHLVCPCGALTELWIPDVDRAIHLALAGTRADISGIVFLPEAIPPDGVTIIPFDIAWEQRRQETIEKSATTKL